MSHRNNRCELQKSVCAFCGLPVNVTVVVRNLVQTPTFELTVSLTLRQGSLLKVFEEAVEVDNRLRFKAMYHPTIGYYINVINSLESSAENATYWNIVNQNGENLKCGVSTYVPGDGETILFNFTTYQAAGNISSLTTDTIF